MFTKILYAFGKFALFTAKNMLRLTLVVSYGLCKFIGWLAAMLQDLAFHGCVSMGIFKLATEDENELKQAGFEQKFTEDDIDAMAQELGGKKVTIKEIQDMLGVSYRQARKVQIAAEKSLPVTHYSKEMALA